METASQNLEFEEAARIRDGFRRCDASPKNSLCPIPATTPTLSVWRSMRHGLCPRIVHSSGQSAGRGRSDLPKRLAVRS
ncbi:UvrB/UvrC motif-containing protein [Shigella flexneri]